MGSESVSLLSFLVGLVPELHDTDPIAPEVGAQEIAAHTSVHQIKNFSSNFAVVDFVEESVTDDSFINRLKHLSHPAASPADPSLPQLFSSDLELLIGVSPVLASRACQAMLSALASGVNLTSL